MENVVKQSNSAIPIDCIPPAPRLAASADCPFRPRLHRRNRGAHTVIIAKTIGKPCVSVTYPILEHRHEVRHGIVKDSTLLRTARGSSSEFAAKRSGQFSTFHVICFLRPVSKSLRAHRSQKHFSQKQLRAAQRSFRINACRAEVFFETGQKAVWLDSK